MGRKPGTTSFDEEKALELYHKGMNDREIAGELYVSSASICAWRQRRGLPTNFSPMYRGKRPVVTVDVPEGLKTDKEREEIELTKAETMRELRPCTDAEVPATGPVEISLSLCGGLSACGRRTLQGPGRLQGLCRSF